jgi:hypothetical protein
MHDQARPDHSCISGALLQAAGDIGPIAEKALVSRRAKDRTRPNTGCRASKERTGWRLEG